jgi:lysyl-tRNA synthetase, class I
MVPMNDLVIPTAIEAVIRGFDTDPKAASPSDVRQAISNAVPNASQLSDTERRGAAAEVNAFTYSPARARESPWRTYFAPSFYASDKSGKDILIPDASTIDLATISHWSMRARNLKHPMLVARYADLAWDFAGLVPDQRRDPEMARRACDGYMAAAQLEPKLHPHEITESLSRALMLAITINDHLRTDAARALLMTSHREAIASRSNWWNSFDILIDNRHARLSASERAELLGSLETLLRDFSDITDPSRFNPDDAEAVAKRLIRVYRRDGKEEEVRRLLALVGRTLEHFAGLATPMLASVVLQTSINAYRDAGLRSESERVRVLMQEKIATSHDEMVPITVETEIKIEDMESFLSVIAVDDPGQTLANIANAFLTNRKRIEDLVLSSADVAPLQARLTRMIMSDDYVAAKIGSIDEDMHGRVLHQTFIWYNLNNIWLHQSLSQALERHALSPQHIVAWTNRLGLFPDVSFLTEGVIAWLEADLTKALHVLIPQIEAGLRGIVAKAGKPTTKAQKDVKGASFAVNMGDMLNNIEIQQLLGPDLTLHFLSLYADPRGVNLRNRIAHGLIKPESVTMFTANWVIHSLLVLGVWDKLAEVRR